MQRSAMNRSGVRRGGSLVPAAVLAVARRRLGLGFGLVALLALALQALVGASTAQARPAPESFADLVEGLLPAVVNIQTQQSIERSEEHTSELQSLMRISSAVFCLKKKNMTSNS